MIRALLPTVACLLGTLPLLLGCGEGGEDLSASVPVAGTIETAPFSLERVTLTATGTGDRLEADGVTARIERSDGSREDVDVAAGGDGTSLTLGPAAVTVSEVAETRNQAPSQADVRVLATLQADTPGQIDGVTLVARDPQDTFDIAGARAFVLRADGGMSPVALDISADATQVTLGSFPVALPPGTGPYWELNRLVIEGPVWVTDGATNSRTQIGRLGFSFGANDADEVVSPTTVQACIPTIGTASDRRVVCAGLDPTEYVWVVIEDVFGGVTYSRTYFPDTNGRAVIPDTLGLFTAEQISGPDSGIEVAFGDASRRPPPPVPWPPAPGGGGPGGGDDSRLNVLVIEGPLSAVHGATGRRTELGRVRLGFEVLADGTVVAPAALALRVPVNGRASDPSIGLTGLQAGDFAQTRLVDRAGAAAWSALARAQPDGTAVIPDAWGGRSAAVLSGPASRLSLLVARTDGDADGRPDAF